MTTLKTWFEAWKLLSAVLVAMGFGGIALVLSERPLAGSGALPGSASLVLAGLFCVGMALDQWRRWQVGRLEQRGWELLVAGRPEAAIRALDVAASGGTDTSRARSLHGLTLAWLRTGDYERALALSERAARARKGGSATLRLAQAPALKATVLALYGELDEARRQVREIQRPVLDRTDYAMLAQAVVLCREGRYLEAVKRIQHSVREHVPELDVGAVAVVHAFARGQLGGQWVPLKLGCVLPEKPARGSEHEYLALEWPELAAWLRRLPSSRCHPGSVSSRAPRPMVGHAPRTGPPMSSPRFKPLAAAFIFSLASPLVAPLDAHAAPACSGQGLAFYPMSAPFKLLDTSQGWTAWWPRNYPLSNGWGLRLDGHASVIPDNAQVLVARVTLSNYRGEWPECQWYDNAYYEGYRCSRDGEDSTAERYPRLRVSTAQPAPSTGAGVIRVGSGPSRPTEQLVTIPLAADGSFVLTADSVFDTRVEVLGYYAAPGGSGALYLHLLDTPAPTFNAFDGLSADPHQLGRSMYAGESHDVPVVGTWNVGINFGGPFSYTIPSDAKYVVGNAFAYLNWTLESPYGVEQVSAFRPGSAVPETGLALTSWDGFGEGYEHLTPLANGAMTVHSSAPTTVVYYVSGYFSPRRDNDGNGPGLLYFPRAHALKGSGSVAADDFAGQRLYVPTYDGDPQACGVAAAGRLRFIGEGDGNGQEFGILTPGTRASAAGIATGSVTNDEVTFVRRFGTTGGYEVYADTADRPGTTLRFEVDTFGVFSP